MILLIFRSAVKPYCSFSYEMNRLNLAVIAFIFFGIKYGFGLQMSSQDEPFQFVHLSGNDNHQETMGPVGNPANDVSQLSAYYRQCNNTQITFPISKSKNPQQYGCITLAQAARDSIPLNDNHPIVKAARIIPGYPSGGRKTNTISVTIPQTHTWWRSTGVFAWPGSTITVTVPSFMVTSNYKLQIGCHTDDLSGKDDLYRWPVVSMSVPISSTKFTFKTYAGGIIYLDIGRITDKQPATLTLSGQIVSTPRFLLGKTSNSAWKKMVASSVAPLTEIESEHMVVVFNSSQAKWVSNVHNLATFYDRMFAKFYELSGSPVRTYKQYIVVDVQILLGWAHSGHPIMFDDNYNAGGDNSWTRSLTIEGIEVATADRYAGGPTQWGTRHEIGHNFQKNQWTSSDEREVTNNIFAMYLGELYPDGPNQFGSRDFGPDARAGLTGDFAKLPFYVDLKEAFGWEAFKQFFRVFEKDPTITASSTTDVRDNWLKYFSQVVKRDISSLYTKYNKTVSTSARSFASKFRAWNPNDIIDCKTATLAKSPCITASYHKRNAQVCMDMVAWVRVNTSEALEVIFKGAPANSTVKLASGARVKSATYNPNTRVLRIVSTTRINPEEKHNWCFRVSSAFSFNDITARVVSLATSRIVNVPERSLEGVVTV